MGDQDGHKLYKFKLLPEALVMPKAVFDSLSPSCYQFSVLPSKAVLCGCVVKHCSMVLLLLLSKSLNRHVKTKETKQLVTPLIFHNPKQKRVS